MIIFPRWITWIGIFLGVGCASGAIRPSSPWKEELKPYFDDCIDMVGDISRLEGRWAEEQRAQLEGRSYYSDLVARVKIVSVHTTIDTEGQQTKTFTVSFSDTLYGTAPGETLDITCRKSQVGYDQIEHYEKTGFLDKTFILFIKWYEDKDDNILPHFHMSIADPAVEILVETMVDKRKSEEAHSAKGKRS